jgi:pyrroloquinoline quinone biosynthesis protein B
MIKQVLLLFCFSLLCGNTRTELIKKTAISDQYITVLGIAQDAEYPHIGCQKSCCINFYKGKHKKQKVVSLGLVDIENRKNGCLKLLQISPRN